MAKQIFLSGKIKDEIWDAEYRNLEIKDKKDRETTIKPATRYNRGRVRSAMGLFYTDNEWEKKDPEYTFTLK